jgi:hypothetical protein
MQTAVAASNVFPALFCSFAFSTGTIYIWTGVGPYSYGGNTYTGLGDFIAMDKVTEDSQIAARSVKFTLNGIPSSTIANALTSDYRGKACKVLLGCFDAGGSLISTPIQIFGGLMNQMIIADAGETCTVELTVESRLIDLQRQRERRFTNEDQKFFHPSDTGLQYVAGLQDQAINWGAATPSASSGAASGIPGSASHVPNAMR